MFRLVKELLAMFVAVNLVELHFQMKKYDHSRPIGLLTHPNEEYGNVRVYTDTMEFVKFDSKK